jgi:ankyrin repeat protein
MLACYNGHSELASLLIKHGASPNILNDRLQSCLAGVLFKKEEDIIQILIDANADPTYGKPSGEECMKMFGGEEKWAAIFSAAPGRGKGVEEFEARNAKRAALS